MGNKKKKMENGNVFPRKRVDKMNSVVKLDFSFALWTNKQTNQTEYHNYKFTHCGNLIMPLKWW